MPKADNAARETRLLDAAADLFVHYGYDKTTVSDIARQAGVSKGAIYLHFPSKDALFEALLVRELQAYGAVWIERVEADPDGGTLGGMYKNMLYAMSGSPFMAAMFKQDRRMFGSYLRQPDNFFRRHEGQRSQSTRHEFVQLMQDAGAIRADLDAKVIAHIMNMLAYGLVSVGDVIDEAHIPPLDDVIEGIAALMDRAMTPEDGGNSEAGKAIVRELFEAGKERLEQQKNQPEDAS